MDKESQPWGRLWVNTIGSLVIAVTIYVVGVSIYRVTLHPLAKYPGPFLSKITDWSIVLQARSGDRHLETWEEHEKYGPIVRIGPNTLSFNTDTALKTIYGSRKSNVTKSDWYRTIDAGSKAFSLHSEIDPSRHAFRRRVVNQAFSKTTKATDGLILENINKCLEALGADADSNSWTRPKDIEDWCDWLSLDIMGILTFGRGFDCVKGGKNRIVSQLALEATKFVYVAGFLPFISLVRPLVGTKLASMLFIKDAKKSEDWNTLVNDMMNECIMKNQDENEKGRSLLGPTDFISHLLKTRDPETGQGLTVNELHADSALLIHAGSHTTALALSAAIFYLTQPNHKHILEVLQKEVRRTFPSVKDIRLGAKLNSLEYLRAVMDETLRMCPPVPSHLPREVLSGGLEIDGQHFPQGTIVGVAPWAIHHNSEYYLDPFRFDPERWLSNGDERKVATARAAFCPFSIGPRGCAGKGMAYDKISLVLAILLWVYDVRGVATTSADTQQSSSSRYPVRARADVYQIRDHFVAEGAGVKVELRRKVCAC